MNVSRRAFLAGPGVAATARANTPGGLIADWAKLWLPPQRLTLSRWAEKNFHLSSEYSATTRTIQLYGWQRDIFDSFTDPRVQKIVLKVGTQLVKTLFIQCALAYVICATPGPVLLSQPKDNDAETFSKERLGPMLRDNPLLRDRIEDKKSPLNTIAYKQFPGGSLTLVGAMVPGNAARRSIQFYFGDEVNKYPKSVGNEGSFLRLAEERVVTFGSRAKLIYACSPTEPTAAISREYEASDQREPWVECFNCGHSQVMTWAQAWWSKTVAVEDRPETARYICEKCEAQWNDNQRWRAADAAKWIAKKPFRGTAGFGRLGHLYSPHKTLAKMVRTWLEIDASKDVNELKVFINTNLAEDWREKGEAPEWKRLYDRREDYPLGKIPRGALFLTAFVDVQQDRLEFELKAWGRKLENWSIWYEVIAPERPGPDSRAVKTTPSDPEPWERLAALLLQAWEHVDGGSLPIWICGIDSGNNPDPVYAFCRQWAQPAYGPAGAAVPLMRTVVPTKGGDSPLKLIEHISDTDAARKRHGLKIVTIGTHYAKQELYDALRLESPLDGQPFPPRYCHHPKAYDESYFQGVTAETRIVKANSEVIWRKDGRNEPLDDHVGNRAMAELCGISRFTEEDWAALEALIEESRHPAQVPELQAAAEQPKSSWIGGRSGWFNR